MTGKPSLAVQITNWLHHLARAEHIQANVQNLPTALSQTKFI